MSQYILDTESDTNSSDSNGAFSDSLSQDFEEYSITSLDSSLIESLEEDIERDEKWHDENPIQHKQHCVGMFVVYQEFPSEVSQFLFVIRITPETYFKYPVADLASYLTDFYAFHFYETGQEMAASNLITRTLDIMQIYHDYSQDQGQQLVGMTISIEPRYQVVVKTIWLKLVQKEWRKRCSKAKKDEQIRIRKKGLPYNQNYFQNSGRYPQGLSQPILPSLKGLMAQYRSNHQHQHLSLPI